MGIRTAFSIAGFAFIIAVTSLPAHATTQRAFVATTGNDANAALNCSRVSPCRSFAVAIGITDPGGSVVVLESGGYGPVTITQAVAVISPPGVHAAITAVSGQPAIVVNAPLASVTLRGLYLEGRGIGSNGIEYHVRNGSALFVENVVVDGFSGNGFSMERGVALEHAALVVQDSVFRNNNQSGIYLTNGDFIDTPRESIVIDNTRVTRNHFGIVGDGGFALVRNCVVADGSSVGIWARAADGPTRIVVTGTAVYRMDAGVFAESGGIIEMGTSSVVHNHFGGRFKNVGGSLITRTGNLFSDNSSNDAWTSTIPTE